MTITDKIKGSNRLGKELLYLSEWDVSLEVRSMSARQRSNLQSVVGDDSLSTGDRQEAMWSYLLCNCCYDPDTGAIAFQDSDMEWLLNEASFSVIDEIANKCLAVSAIGQKASDDLGKSFSASPTAEG